MFEDLVFPLFYRSIAIGFLFGLAHFILVSPIKYDSNAKYLRFIGYNLIFVLVGLPIIYFLFRNSFQFVSYMSSLHTNSLFALFTFFLCVITSLIFFGFFKFANFADRISNSYPNLAPVAFLFDINLYWFVLNAYLISAYSVNSLQWLLLVIFGFSMSLSISNLRYHIRSKIQR